MVLINAEEPLLTAVNEGTFPVPLAAKPVAVLLFVQLADAVPGVRVNVPVGTVAPAQ